MEKNKLINENKPAKGTNEVLFDMFKSEGFEIDIKQVNKKIFELKAMGVGKGLDIMKYYAFIKKCITLGLDPIKNEIYAYVAGGELVTPISFLVYLARASKHPNYQLPILEEHFWDKDGNELPLDKCYIVGKVQRKGDETAMTKTFFMKEWSRNTDMWRKQPKHMLSVRVLKNMLAIAYPEEVGALETEEFTADVAFAKPVEASVKRPTKPVPPPVKELSETEVAAVFAPLEEGEE